MTAEEIVARARSFVGVRFRPQGRDPHIGIDCIGLILCVFEIPAEQVRRDYRLRAPANELEAELSRRFARVSTGEGAAGDVLLCASARNQAHLAISTGMGIIHADAGLRRVAERPGACPWPVTGVFRANPDRSRS